MLRPNPGNTRCCFARAITTPRQAGMSAGRLRTGSDLVEHAAVGEELRLRLAPVAEQLRDGESLHHGKLRGVFLRHRGETRTIEMPRFDVLRPRRVQEFQV